VNHNFTLRPGLPTDLPEIAILDIAAYPHHHMARLAWSNSSDTCPVFLSCYELISSLAHCHFLVAMPEEVAGFVIWKECGDHEEPEFKTQSPESANVGMVTYFLGKNRELRKDLRNEGMAELEILDMKSGHQRKGIGVLLLEEVVKEARKILDLVLMGVRDERA
jgi:GNAT superfamily N-acetyltransferase